MIVCLKHATRARKWSPLEFGVDVKKCMKKTKTDFRAFGIFTYIVKNNKIPHILLLEWQS